MKKAAKNECKNRPVRRLLRHRRSQEYFTGTGWTRQIDQARTYADCLEAARTCADCGLSEVELVLRVKDGTADLYSTELR